MHYHTWVGGGEMGPHVVCMCVRMPPLQVGWDRGEKKERAIDALASVYSYIRA